MIVAGDVYFLGEKYNVSQPNDVMIPMKTKFQTIQMLRNENWQAYKKVCIFGCAGIYDIKDVM